MVPLIDVYSCTLRLGGNSGYDSYCKLHDEQADFTAKIALVQVAIFDQQNVQRHQP